MNWALGRAEPGNWGWETAGNHGESKESRSKYPQMLRGGELLYKNFGLQGADFGQNPESGVNR